MASHANMSTQTCHKRAGHAAIQRIHRNKGHLRVPSSGVVLHVQAGRNALVADALLGRRVIALHSLARKRDM
eukprot:363885-Chlamydomonas_euryale.AAC.24